MTTDTPDRILRINAVLQRTGLTRSTLYRKIQHGTFPKQVQIAARCTGWRESAVAEWMRIQCSIVSMIIRARDHYAPNQHVEPSCRKSPKLPFGISLNLA